MERLQKLITSVTFQRWANKKAVSAFFGWLANIRLPKPWLHRLIHAFVHSFHIDLSEYDYLPDRVRTFNEFFARKLKSGVRVFSGSLCSPADGFIASFGPVLANQMFQVKGKPYSLNELLQEKQPLQMQSYLNLVGVLVGRELGLPVIIGATDATKILKTGMRIRMECDTGRIQII